MRLERAREGTVGMIVDACEKVYPWHMESAEVRGGMMKI